MVCGDAALRDGVAQVWPQMPRTVLFEEIFVRGSGVADDERTPIPLADSDPVTIIYTSGTSGEPKGVVLNVGNLNHMLRCTSERLDLLMGETSEPDRVFHYLPFCFAGSWILLLSCLSRHAVLTINTDLDRIKQDLELAAPDYFLNVPTLLERVRAGIEDQIKKRGGIAQTIFEHATKAYLRGHAGKSGVREAFWLALGRRAGVSQDSGDHRSEPEGADLRLGAAGPGNAALLHHAGHPGAAGLRAHRNHRHLHHGRPAPRRARQGRPGDPRNRDAASARTKRSWCAGPTSSPATGTARRRPRRSCAADGSTPAIRAKWTAAGNWRIIGRIKNLIILNSGHNVAPEPLEDELLRRLPGAQQVVLVGNGCSFLAAIITGNVRARRGRARCWSNSTRTCRITSASARSICRPKPSRVENGLLTANGKLKRDAIAARFRAAIEEMYAPEGVAESAKPA